ncbi:hypothetical protein TNCV_2430261 [Trichonephila clavipes]|nr:hypothetical protein TNCV_2430261 [Trichonephila clavipes]
MLSINYSTYRPQQMAPRAAQIPATNQAQTQAVRDKSSPPTSADKLNNDCMGLITQTLNQTIQGHYLSLSKQRQNEPTQNAPNPCSYKSREELKEMYALVEAQLDKHYYE